MITLSSPEPSGVEGTKPFYHFFGRIDRRNTDLITRAQAKARGKLGGSPSNSVLLIELLTSYLGDK